MTIVIGLGQWGFLCLILRSYIPTFVLYGLVDVTRIYVFLSSFRSSEEESGNVKVFVFPQLSQILSMLSWILLRSTGKFSL